MSFSPLFIFLTLLWTCSDRSMSFFSWRPQIWVWIKSYESGTESDNHLPWSDNYHSFDAAQDMDGFLGCKHTQLVHIVFIQQYLQAGLHRYILNPVTVTVFHSCLGLPLPMCSTLYLALFNSMRFSSTHLSNPSTSLRMASFPFSTTLKFQTWILIFLTSTWECCEWQDSVTSLLKDCLPPFSSLMTDSFSWLHCINLSLALIKLSSLLS